MQGCGPQLMTVLIIGGGIGGLTTALSLHQIGVEAQIFESVPRISPLGVGINTLPHAVRELTELGLRSALEREAVATSGNSPRGGDQPRRCNSSST